MPVHPKKPKKRKTTKRKKAVLPVQDELTRSSEAAGDIPDTPIQVADIRAGNERADAAEEISGVDPAGVEFTVAEQPIDEDTPIPFDDTAKQAEETVQNTLQSDLPEPEFARERVQRNMFTVRRHPNDKKEFPELKGSQEGPTDPGREKLKRHGYDMERVTY